MGVILVDIDDGMHVLQIARSSRHCELGSWMAWGEVLRKSLSW
jgi:hypothetical protein